MILTSVLIPAIAIVLAIYALSKISSLEHKIWQFGQELAKLKAAGAAAEARPAEPVAPVADASVAAAEKSGKREHS